MALPLALHLLMPVGLGHLSSLIQKHCLMASTLFLQWQWMTAAIDRSVQIN